MKPTRFVVLGLFCTFGIICLFFLSLTLFLLFQDPSNLQGKVQKHQAFEAELSANQSRIDALQKSGQELIDGKHYASSEVSTRMDEVSSQWKKLLEATELKGEKMAQYCQFHRKRQLSVVKNCVYLIYYW